MATYLVTGGLGFIGSHLADVLIAGGNQVRILDNLSTGSGDHAPAGAEVTIGDVVAMLVAAMDRQPAGPQVYNACTGVETTVRELATTLGAICGVKAEMRFGPPRAGDIKISCGDPAKGEKALGIKAGTGLAAGLEPTLEWIRKTP